MIPKSFKLANRTWKVSFVKNLRSPDGDALWGMTVPATACIKLDRQLLEPGMAEMQEHVFEHELHHALFTAHGRVDHEEHMIEGLAGLRRQFTLTARYGTPGKKKPGKAKARRV